MKKLVRQLDRLSAVGGALSGVMLCLGLVLFLMEIVVRTVFRRTLYITEEYSGYLMCALTFCALAYTLSERGHIRMTFLHEVVKGRSRVWLDLACCAVGLVFCSALTFFTGRAFLDSVATQSRSMQISETYLAIPQFFMPLGALLITLQFLGEIIRCVFILRRDTDGLPLKEEIEGLGR